MDTQTAAHIATIVAAMSGTVVLGFTAIQMRQNAQAHKEGAKARTEDANMRTAAFWLELRQLFANHDAGQMKLTPGGSWADSEGTISKEGDRYVIQWARNDSYRLERSGSTCQDPPQDKNGGN